MRLAWRPFRLDPSTGQGVMSLRSQSALAPAKARWSQFCYHRCHWPKRQDVAESGVRLKASG